VNFGKEHAGWQETSPRKESLIDQKGAPQLAAKEAALNCSFDFYLGN
jgi:hypothetical protein